MDDEVKELLALGNTAILKGKQVKVIVKAYKSASDVDKWALWLTFQSMKLGNFFKINKHIEKKMTQLARKTKGLSDAQWEELRKQVTASRDNLKREGRDDE
jgi:hypothetical protein